MTEQPQAELTAESLAAAGAHPVQVDADALLAKMKEMQAQIDSLSVQTGVPSDPVEFARKNLLDHLKAHAAANPTASLDEAIKAVEDEAVSPELVAVHLEDAVNNHRHLDLHYVAQLGRDFRKALAQK